MLKDLLLAAFTGLLLMATAAAQPGIPAIHSLAQLQDSLRHVMAREYIPGLMFTVRYFGQFRRWAVAWHLLLTYGTLGWLAAVLATYGWMSLRVWAV